MGYVPGCRYDLFISYASENNSDGWVEQFAQVLGHELTELLGRQFDPKESIFLDGRALRAGQSFPHELASAARDSAILVPVLSPSYLTSKWCDLERQEFFSRLSEGAQPSECLAPILVRPIDENDLLELYRNAEQMSFLSPDGHTPFAVSSPEWIAQLRKFATQLTKALQVLRQRCKPVFLGKTVNTERAEKLRSWCCTEIERRHFRTVPQSLQALANPDAVRSNLENAGLAIHFLGGADAAAADAIETSIAVCTGPTILYQPYESEITAQEEFWLTNFENQLSVPPGRYQRLRGKNDYELLLLVGEQLSQVHANSAREILEPDLTLLCEKADMEGVRQLKTDILKAYIVARQPIKIETPDFLVTGLKKMEETRRWLNYIDHIKSALFYHGILESPASLELLWQTTEKIKPAARCAWYLAPPDVESKKRRYSPALWCIHQVIGFMELDGSASS